MKILLVLVMTFFLGSISLACSCLPNKKITKSEVENSTDVFIGKVVSIDTLPSRTQLVVKFKVNKTYKGAEDKFVEVRTAIHSAACGVSVEVGEKWYVFAKESKGKININSCGRHVDLTKPKCWWFAEEKKIAKAIKKQYKAQKKANKEEVKFVKSVVED